MNPHTAEQARQPGGRFGSKLPPPAPPTAVQELARLAALRSANGGFLVLPPMPLEQLALARVVHPDSASGETLPRPNAEYRAVEQWLRDIVSAGGSPADLQLAWDRWRPIHVGPANPKYQLGKTLENAKMQAGPPHLALHQRAEAEQRPARHLAEAKSALQAAEKALAEVVSQHEAAQAKAEQARATLAKLEGHDGPSAR